jgi:hypothetical protein
LSQIFFRGNHVLQLSKGESWASDTAPASSHHGQPPKASQLRLTN